MHNFGVSQQCCCLACLSECEVAEEEVNCLRTQQDAIRGMVIGAVTLLEKLITHSELLKSQTLSMCRAAISV